jgi:TolA-binding protein
MLLVFTSVSAQKTNIYNPDAKYKNAIQLYEKGKYAMAQQMFKEFIKTSGKIESFQVEEAKYYEARCAMQLFNRDADYLITKYIKTHKNTGHFQEASYEMALFQYQKKKYKNAVKWFELTDKHKLTNKQLPEYSFKYGYSLYLKRDLDKASLLFYDIKDSIENEYNSAAIYYYAHIAYQQKKYQTALDNFLKLQNDDVFSPIAPYYITQIYYLQNKYDKIIEYAPSLIDSVSEKRYPEIARIIGEAYYKTEKFKEAVPYLEIYKEYALDLTKEDIYQLAYSYYKSEQYDKAINNFSALSGKNDTISQKADIAMADCFIKTNQKGKAMTAFYAASKVSIDKETQEEAFFNYAKLTYELSASPFNDAIDAFTQFVKLYPDSKYSDEAYDYLGKAYLITKNYKAAIESYEQIVKITKDIEIAYQRITFFRGIELFKNASYGRAIINFNKSVNNSHFDKTIKARALYWRGESYYRMHRYNDAIKSFTDFSTTPGSYLLVEYLNLHYNLGYCYFKKKNYKQAETWFRKYTDLAKEKDTYIMNDAYIRIGDCFFMLNKTEFATDYYEKAIEINKRDIDYALFQKGFSLGLLGKSDEEIIVLSRILNDFDSSPYADDANFEIGNTYFNQEQNEMAISSFTSLINDYPHSPYIPKALDKLGLIYMNQKQYEEAIDAYKKVVENYPESSSSGNAKFGLETIYTKIIGDADAYIDYLKSINQEVNITELEQDSLNYTTAERFYLHGNCDKSKELFAKYIDKYKNGKYLLNANFYKAECNYNAEEYSEALKSYSYIAGLPKSEFTELSIERACDIAYSQEKYSEAIELYKKLEKNADKQSNILKARLGLMRCYYKEEDSKQSIKAAINVLKDTKISDNIYREAHYVIASSFYKGKDYDGAFDEFQMLSEDVSTKEGAEAKYRLIEIYFIQDKYDDAEFEINDFRKASTSYQEWLAKSFIIWSDIFKSRSDYHMAKSVLQIIIDKYKGSNNEIVDIATDRYIEIEEQEDAEQELNEAAEVNVIEKIDEIDKLVDSESDVEKETSEKDGETQNVKTEKEVENGGNDNNKNESEPKNEIEDE